MLSSQLAPSALLASDLSSNLHQAPHAIACRSRPHLHAERLVRPVAVVVFAEGIEAGLLLQDIARRGLGRSFFSVRATPVSTWRACRSAPARTPRASTVCHDDYVVTRD